MRTPSVRCPTFGVLCGRAQHPCLCDALFPCLSHSVPLKICRSFQSVPSASRPFQAGPCSSPAATPCIADAFWRASQVRWRSVRSGARHGRPTRGCSGGLVPGACPASQDHRWAQAAPFPACCQLVCTGSWPSFELDGLVPTSSALLLSSQADRCPAPRARLPCHPLPLATRSRRGARHSLALPRVPMQCGPRRCGGGR